MQDFLYAPGILTVDLNALAANYRYFQAAVGAARQVGAAVKANAYGLGVRQVAKTLQAENCPLFFVATPDEALNLKSIDPALPVASLGGLSGCGREVAALYQAHNIWPVLNTPAEIEIYNALAIEGGSPLPALIHIDTAMNRLGLSAEECEALSATPQKFSHIDIQYITSHYASSDDVDSPLTPAQVQRFEELSVLFPNARKSLANSSGILRQPQHHYHLVRSGIALYGGNPTPETSNPMQPVVHLNVRVLQTRQCKKGESIGYNATHTFDKDTQTATLGFGYADGFHRTASNKAVLYWKGQPCPVIGRVSMDLTTIDLSDITGPQPQSGDLIEVLGPHQDVDQLAASMNTISYEILTSLSQRYKREYI